MWPCCVSIMMQHLARTEQFRRDQQRAMHELMDILSATEAQRQVRNGKAERFVWCLSPAAVFDAVRNATLL